MDRCPRCGYLFNREEGFFLGAVLINFVMTEILLGVVLGVMIAMLASGGGASLTPIVVAAIGETLLVPLLFYPFSRTTWAAVDLLLHRSEAWSAQPSRPDPLSDQQGPPQSAQPSRPDPLSDQQGPPQSAQPSRPDPDSPDVQARVSRAETSTDPSAASQT